MSQLVENAVDENGLSVLKARSDLAEFCVSDEHYKYHGKIRGISHVIPLDAITVSISSSIMVLLRSGLYLIGVKGDNHILYSNGEECVDTFSSPVKRLSVYPDRVSVRDYAMSRELASRLDCMMRDSHSDSYSHLLVMGMPSEDTFEIREMGKSWDDTLVR